MTIRYQGLYFDVGFNAITQNYIFCKFTEDTPSGLNDNMFKISLETVVMTTIFNVS